MSDSQHVLLIGPPNSGKTTLFNWLTGYKRKTVNFPGSTVEIALAPIKKTRSSSLNKDSKKKDSSFTKDLSACQIVDTPGIYSFFSISEERKCILDLLKDSFQNNKLKAVVLVLDATRLKRQLHLFFQLQAVGVPIVLALTMCDIQKKQGQLSIEKLSKQLKIPVYPIEGLLGGGVEELKGALGRGFKKIRSINLESLKERVKEKQLAFLKRATEVVDSLLSSNKNEISWSSHKVDEFLLHPVFGFSFLSFVLFTFFSSIFWVASPIMDGLDSGVSYLVDLVLSLKLGGDLISDFLANGVITGIGAFFNFCSSGIYFICRDRFIRR